MINIGDKVRFLNDVGGGIVKSIKAGGLAMVEDEDGFEIPCLVDDLVAVETNEHNVDIHKFDRWHKNDKPSGSTVVSKEGATSTASMVSGKEYLQSKSPAAKEEVDENLEARVVRLEMQIAKLEARLERLEDSKAAREKEKVQAKQMRKLQKDDIIEVDLHAHEILETTAGMQPVDIKNYQLGVFNRIMQEHIKEKGRKIVFIHGKGDGVLRKAVIDELKYKYKSCEYQDASFQQYGFGATMVIIH